MDWTPWQLIALTGVLGLILVSLAWSAVWYLNRRRAAFMALSPNERASRLFGEAMARCDGEVPSETVDTLANIFAAADVEQKLAIVTAMTGLFDRAKDGPENLHDLPETLLAIFQHFAGASKAPAV